MLLTLVEGLEVTFSTRFIVGLVNTSLAPQVAGILRNSLASRKLHMHRFVVQ